MKLTFLIVLFAVCNIHAQTIIEGKLTNLESWSEEIYLSAISDFEDFHAVTARNYIDTTTFNKKGKFIFDLMELECTDCLYRLELRQKGKNGPSLIGTGNFENYILFELNDLDTISIQADANQFAKTYSMSSKNLNWSIDEIRKIREPVLSFVEKMINDFNATNYAPQIKDSLAKVKQAEMFSLLLSNNEILKDTILKSDNIYFVLNGLSFIDFDSNMANDSLLYEEILNHLQLINSDHIYTKQLSQKLYKFKYVLPKGSIAPNLILMDLTNEEINLHQLNADLILIDFWASWCLPCRKENRNTVRPLYEAYKEKGFEVLSVSMDDKKERWEKAIIKDRMDWVNVSDLLGKYSPVYNIYKIEQLPTTYVIDGKSKRIVARNMRGEELVDFISNYFESK